MRIRFPRNFVNNNCIPDFLSEAVVMFGNEQKSVPNVLYDCTKIHRISILGALLFYKTIDYAFRNNCFGNPQISGNATFLESAWLHYGFLDYFKNYIEPRPGSTVNEYITFQLNDKFVLAPQPLFTKERKQVNEILQKKFIPTLNTFYTDNVEAVSMIFSCISEIIGNFWEHAADDYSSLLVAEGNKEYIEISCADTGKGIISTMRDSNRFKRSASPEFLIKKALTKGVTSKPLSNHMGYGLWIINQIATMTGGKFFVYSEGVYYGNERGRDYVKKCSFWKGTIIYLFLPLGNPVSMSQVVGKELDKKEDSLLLNFG